MTEQGAELSVTRQCELLDLNRSGVYYTPRPISDQDLRLMRRIDELHLEHPLYGARRLAKQLEREGYEVGRLQVTTLMRRMGIEALYRRPRTSIPARDAKVYPYGGARNSRRLPGDSGNVSQCWRPVAGLGTPR
jgi:putative transposase